MSYDETFQHKRCDECGGFHREDPNFHATPSELKDKLAANKAEIARLREALDDLVAWTGTAKDADHWLAKMDYANGVAKALEVAR